MIRPYLNQYQREAIRLETVLGCLLLVNLAWKKCCREIEREFQKLLERILSYFNCNK